MHRTYLRIIKSTTLSLQAMWFQLSDMQTHVQHQLYSHLLLFLPDHLLFINNNRYHRSKFLQG